LWSTEGNIPVSNFSFNAYNMGSSPIRHYINKECPRQV
jgi:hypothetical protein